MHAAELQGTKGAIYKAQLLPPKGETIFISKFHRYSMIDASGWNIPISLSRPSLLSSAPLTQQQIELGQQIARKHGLTEQD